MQSVTFSYCDAECDYAEYRYAECHYAECHYGVYRNSECQNGECRYAQCRSATNSDIHSSLLGLVINNSCKKCFILLSPWG